MTVTSPAAPADYPVRFDVDYPEQLDRLSSAFRIIWIIPIAFVLAALSPGSIQAGRGAGSGLYVAAAGGGGVLFLPVLLMLVFRQKYPAWWFEWNVQISRFTARVSAYFALLRDEYPSTDDEQAVHLEIDAPRVEELNRWLPLVKWILLFPHYVVLFALAVAVIVVTIIAWFAILFTGQYPRGMFSFVVGVQRWGYRVSGYGFLLTTDRYPPFSLT
jgi:hypothetical protein